MSGINLSCNPFNADAIGPYHADFAWIRSWWSPVNVTAMTMCCAPATAHEDGCFTYCELNKDDHINTQKGYDKWKSDFSNCLVTVGQKAAADSNETFVAPQVTLEKDDFGAAMAVRPGGFGTQGALVLALGILSCLLA